MNVSCAGRKGAFRPAHETVTDREWRISDVVLINWFSWWWARGCSKHVENWNKHIEKNCVSSWSFTKKRFLAILYCTIHAGKILRLLLNRLQHRTWKSRITFTQSVQVEVWNEKWYSLKPDYFWTLCIIHENVRRPHHALADLNKTSNFFFMTWNLKLLFKYGEERSLVASILTLPVHNSDIIYIHL